MQCPRLKAVHLDSEHIVAALPAMTPARHAFVVERPGWFCGRFWSVGELVLCGGLACADDAVVLQPRGRGWPMLGSVSGQGLLGSVGEPCHPGRWGVAGRILGAYQRKGDVWVCCWAHDGEPVERPTLGCQLALFVA